VKCKYWEKDGTCRYGTLCTFAHGDTEVRTKTDNMMLNQQQMGYFEAGAMGFQQPMYDPSMMPMMNPYAMGFDPNMMMNPQFMMGMPQGFDPNMMNPNLYHQSGSSTNGNTNN
jgi:hypothetical protein